MTRSESLKRAQLKYLQTAKGKESRKKINSSNNSKISRKKYHSSEKGKEALKKSQKKYHSTEKGKENLKKIQKKYLQTKKGKEAVRKKMSNLYKNNLKYRLGQLMRTRIKQILKNKNISKKNKTLIYLGCTPSELKLHIEQQFKPGMSWGNWGRSGWHIDHKIPLSSSKNEEDIKKLCHYTNLQPLWALDNLKKSNKVV